MDDNKKIPGIDSWIRINAYDEEDLRRLRDFVYPEDLADVERYLVHLRSEKLSRFVVLNRDQHTYTAPEHVFEQMYLNPEEGVDENAPVENGEMHLFELTSEMDRTSLAKWADSILPGLDLVALQQRVRVGDLVLNRPGSNAFEVFTRSESTSTERAQNRIHILGIMQGDLSKAQAADAWIHGDAE